MKKQKLVALGVVAVTSLATVLPVHAAGPYTGGGTTNVSYTPGSSTGGSEDGTLADWTVDYPMNIALNDSTVDSASASQVQFVAVNTDDQTDYDGSSTIKIKLKSHAEATSDGENITLKDTSSATTDGVTMKMENGGTAVKTNDSAAVIGSLTAKVGQGTENTMTLDAFLSNKTNAKDTQTYSTTLTWVFESDN